MWKIHFNVRKEFTYISILDPTDNVYVNSYTNIIKYCVNLDYNRYGYK